MCTRAFWRFRRSGPVVGFHGLGSPVLAAVRPVTVFLGDFNVFRTQVRSDSACSLAVAFQSEQRLVELGQRRRELGNVAAAPGPAVRTIRFFRSGDQKKNRTGRWRWRRKAVCELCLPLAVVVSLFGSRCGCMGWMVWFRELVTEKKTAHPFMLPRFVGFAYNMVCGGYMSGTLLFLGRYRGFWVHTTTRSSRSFQKGAGSRTRKQ